jgi:hypothetical protein
MNVARRGVEFLSGGDGCIAARLRQRLVGDPGGLSSDFGMKARLPARKQACLRGQAARGIRSQLRKSSCARNDQKGRKLWNRRSRYLKESALLLRHRGSENTGWPMG